MAHVTIRSGARCAPRRGCTNAANPLSVWLTVNADRGVLYHELGHTFDYLALSDDDREAFMRLVGVPGPWRSPPNSPHEQFAAAYALCSQKPRWRLTYDQWGRPRWELDDANAYGFDPSRPTLRRVCALIRNQ